MHDFRRTEIYLRVDGRTFRRRTPTYMSWTRMHERCYNPNHRWYRRYGERGITVCDEWHGFLGFISFVEDMGNRPPGLTLDRIDNRLPYSKSNCRWSTKSEQRRNQERNGNARRHLQHDQPQHADIGAAACAAGATGPELGPVPF